VSELEKRLGFALEPQRPHRFDTNNDSIGWQKGSDGLWHLTLFVENGRINNLAETQLMDALRSVAQRHAVEFRLTPNQNIVISQVPGQDCAKVEALLARFGVNAASPASALRRSSMACVALPTCGLAMAESERYLPSLLSKLEGLVNEHGLGAQAITLRMTGCPNGCARPYVSEIALTGRAPGKYNLYLGGSPQGQRLNVLYAENIGEARILEILDALFARYAKERKHDEAFGDFSVRAGIVELTSKNRLPLATV
jgi:sulfite reductase (NADPH) hemoprotein beta-component